MTKLEQANVNRWVLNDIIEIMHSVAIRARSDAYSEGFEQAVSEMTAVQNSPCKGPWIEHQGRIVCRGGAK